MLPLFVYGSLRKGKRNPWARRLWRDGQDLGPARVRGRLEWPSVFPTWRPARGPAQWVAGDLVRPASPRLLAMIDGYEDSEAYRRRRVMALTADGRRCAAWIYEYVL